MMDEATLIPVTSRNEALDVVELVAHNTPNRDLAPYLTFLLTPADEQTFAIMRGSGTDMSPAEPLVALMAGIGLITTDEACASLEERDAAKGRPVE